MSKNHLSKILIEAFTPDHKTIIDLVKNKRVFSFYYQGDEENKPGWRKESVAVCYGEKEGRRYLRIWQKSGESVSFKKAGAAHRPMPGWRFFRIDRIRNWNLSSQQNITAPPASNFNPNGDKLMDTIYAIADFTPNDKEPPSKPLTPDKGPKKPSDKKKGTASKKDSSKSGLTIPSTGTEPGDAPDDTVKTRNPEKTVHYATTRTPKPVVRMKGNKPAIRVRNGKPVIKMREDDSFTGLIKNIIIELMKK